MAKRPHISELWSRPMLIKALVVPICIILLIQIIPIPEQAEIVVGVIVLAYLVYVGGIISDVMVGSDYGPKPPEEAEGEPQQDQVHNGESHDGRK
ncbi:hypothetical protein [Ciceribacter sp. RN22]|uniref:hypothetical protein n=1 Tax=Ciceribacter sp. RN22 TaxID=2954932 RepID=UPI00209315D5|nr:hypothetical protein [Ciceribacter sp. RN22]MCO6178437.1 hypothetical protein [Ciceribacter sp. RN22]